jgi:hypothetical protein
VKLEPRYGLFAVRALLGGFGGSALGLCGRAVSLRLTLVRCHVPYAVACEIFVKVSASEVDIGGFKVAFGR